MPFKIRLGKRSQQYTLSSKELTIVQIELVDHTKVIECTINALTTGKECLQNVCQRLHIQDDHQFIKYFGLVFLTKKRRFQWIDMGQPVKKQLDKYSDTIRLYIRIQIYVPNVSMIFDDATRSFYYCQLKAHVLDGRLVRFDRHELVLLAAYALQVEFGDYEPDRHTKDFLANNALIPRYLLDTSAPFTSSKEIADSLFESLIVAYRNLQGTAPNEAKLIFISSVQSLELLGQEGFPAKDASDASEANLGVYLKGIFAVKENGISQFPWSEIINLIYEKRTLIIELSCNSSSSIGEKQEYILHDLDFTRYAWEVCVAQHQLYTNGSSFDYNFPVPFLKPSDTSESDGHSQKDLALNHTIASTSNVSVHQSPITSPVSTSTAVFLPNSSCTVRNNPIDDSFKSNSFLNQSNVETPIIDLNCQSSPQISSMSHFNSNSVQSVASINGATGTSVTTGSSNVNNIHPVDSITSLRDHINPPSWHKLIQSSRNDLSNLASHMNGSSILNINDSNDSISSNVINNNHMYGQSNVNNTTGGMKKHVSNNIINFTNNNDTNNQTDEIYSNSRKSQLSLLSSLLASSHLDTNSNLNTNHVEYSDYVNGAAIDFAVKKLTESQSNCDASHSSPSTSQCHNDEQQRNQLLNQFNSAAAVAAAAAASNMMQSKLTSVDSVPLLTATDAASMLIRKSTNDSDPIYANANACKSLSTLASQSELLNDLLGHSSNSNINFLSSLTSTSPSMPSSSDSYDKRPLSYNERLAHLPPYKEPPSYDEYVQKKYGIDGVMLPYDVATVGTSIAPHHINTSFHHDQCGILMGDKITTATNDCHANNLFDANDTDIKCELNTHCQDRQCISKMNRFTSQSVGSLSTKLPDNLDYSKNEFNTHLMKAYLLQQKLGYNASSDAFHLYQNLNYKPEDLINASVTDPSGYAYCDESIYSTVKPKNVSNIASSSSSSGTRNTGGGNHLTMTSQHQHDDDDENKSCHNDKQNQHGNSIGDYTQRSLTLNESNNPYSVKACTSVPISLSMDEIGPVTGNINTRKELCDVYNNNSNNSNNDYICRNSLFKEQTSHMGGAIELPGCESSSSGYLDSKKKMHELNLKVKLSTSTGMTGSTVSSASTAAAAAAAATGANVTATMRTTASTSSSAAFTTSVGASASQAVASAAAAAGVTGALNGSTCTSYSTVPGYSFVSASNVNNHINKITDIMPSNLSNTCSVSSATLDMNASTSVYTFNPSSSSSPAYTECANRINSSCSVSSHPVSMHSTVLANQNNIRHINSQRVNGNNDTSNIQLNQLNSNATQAMQQYQPHQQLQHQHQHATLATPTLSLGTSNSACHFIQNHSPAAAAACVNLNNTSHNSQLLNQMQPVQASSFQVSRQLALYYGSQGQRSNNNNNNSPSPNGNGNIPNYLLAHQQLVQQQRQQYLIRSQGNQSNSFQSTPVNVTGVTYTTQASMPTSLSSCSATTSTCNQYQSKSASLQRHLFNNYQQQVNQHSFNQLPCSSGQQQQSQQQSQLTQISLNANRRNAAPAYSFQSVPDLTQPVQANVVRGQSFSQYAQSKVGPMGSGPQMCFPVECRNIHQHCIQSNLQQQRKSLITSSVNALPSIVSGTVCNVGKFIASPSKSSSGYSVVNKTQNNRRITPPGSGSVPNLPNMMMASEQQQFITVKQQQQRSDVNENINKKCIHGVSDASCCLLTSTIPSTVTSSDSKQTLDYTVTATGDSSSSQQANIVKCLNDQNVNCHQLAYNNHKNTCSIQCNKSQQVTGNNVSSFSSSSSTSPCSSPSSPPLTADTSVMHACSSTSTVSDALKEMSHIQMTCSTASTAPPHLTTTSNSINSSSLNRYNRSRECDEKNLTIMMKENVDDTCVNNEYNSPGKSDKSLGDTENITTTKVTCFPSSSSSSSSYHGDAAPTDGASVNGNSRNSGYPVTSYDRSGNFNDAIHTTNINNTHSQLYPVTWSSSPPSSTCASSYSLPSSSHITCSSKQSCDFITPRLSSTVSCESACSSSTLNRPGTSGTFSPATMNTSVVTSGENGKVTYELLPCPSSSSTSSLPVSSVCSTLSNDLVTSNCYQPSTCLPAPAPASSSTPTPVTISTLLLDQHLPTQKSSQYNQLVNKNTSNQLDNNINHENCEHLPLQSKLEKIRNEIELQQQQLQEKSAALSQQVKNLANTERKVYDIIVVHTKSNQSTSIGNNDAVNKLNKSQQQQQVVNSSSLSSDSSCSPSSLQPIDSDFTINCIDCKSDQIISLNKQKLTLSTTTTTTATTGNNIVTAGTIAAVSSSHPIPQPRVTTANKIKDQSHVTSASSTYCSSSSSSNVMMTVENEILPSSPSSSTPCSSNNSEQQRQINCSENKLHQSSVAQNIPSCNNNGAIQRANRPKNLYEGTSPVLNTEDECDSINNVSTPTKSRSNDPRIGKIEGHMTSPLFRKEFDSIPRKDSTAIVTTALLPENIGRNRFMDILPYEFNRVKIECGKDNRCKYINASHVTINIGSSVHRYIAAQGPLCDTVIEFWYAVWLNKVAVIVMVTELEEGGHEKCFKYFPSEIGSSVTFGPFSINCKSSEHTLSYVTSVFTVTHVPSNSSREIWHIRYTDWQDHTCPHVGAFIEFLDHIDALNRTFNRESGGSIRSTGLLHETHNSTSSFNSKSSRLSALFSSLGRSSKSKLNHLSHAPASPTTSSSSSSNSSLPPSNLTNNCNSHQQDNHNSTCIPPLLVHCSAGVGRSGVVILCDALIRSLDSVNGEIDVPQVLTQLRMQRMNSIQNFTQYCFVYRVLSHYLHNSRLI